MFMLLIINPLAEIFKHFICVKIACVLHNYLCFDIIKWHPYVSKDWIWMPFLNYLLYVHQNFTISCVFGEETAGFQYPVWKIQNTGYPYLAAKKTRISVSDNPAISILCPFLVLIICLMSSISNLRFSCQLQWKGFSLKTSASNASVFYR